MDIAWVYFQTQDASYLSEASWRLEKAQESFKKAWGENNERLNVIRGGASPEMVLYVRLYLLQGVIAIYEGNPDERRGNDQ